MKRDRLFNDNYLVLAAEEKAAPSGASKAPTVKTEKEDWKNRDALEVTRQGGQFVSFEQQLKNTYEKLTANHTQVSESVEDTLIGLSLKIDDTLDAFPEKSTKEKVEEALSKILDSMVETFKSVEKDTDAFLSARFAEAYLMAQKSLQALQDEFRGEKAKEKIAFIKKEVGDVLAHIKQLIEEIPLNEHEDGELTPEAKQIRTKAAADAGKLLLSTAIGVSMVASTVAVASWAAPAIAVVGTAVAAATGLYVATTTLLPISAIIISRLAETSAKIVSVHSKKVRDRAINKATNTALPPKYRKNNAHIYNTATRIENSSNEYKKFYGEVAEREIKHLKKNGKIALIVGASVLVLGALGIVAATPTIDEKISDIKSRVSTVAKSYASQVSEVGKDLQGSPQVRQLAELVTLSIQMGLAKNQQEFYENILGVSDPATGFSAINEENYMAIKEFIADKGLLKQKRLDIEKEKLRLAERHDIKTEDLKQHSLVIKEYEALAKQFNKKYKNTVQSQFLPTGGDNG